MGGIPLHGNWKEGYAVDLHTLNSVCIGEDEYGHPQFDTQYSDIGQLYMLSNIAEMPLPFWA